MRVATRPLLGIAALSALAACGAAALYRPRATAPTAMPGRVPHPVSSPASPRATAIAEPPPPPPVSAIGDARGFDGVSNVWLRPGRFVWKPDRASAGPVGIVVDLGRQMAYVYRAGTLIGVSTVSTGRRHYETPVGAFSILEKAVWHRSTIYSGAPMPYMQRLTWGGVALHSGGVPGYRQSHGCIHLPAPFARSLFRVTRIGSEVRVVRRFDDATAMPGPPVTIASRTPVPATFPTTEQSAAVIIAAAL